MVAFTQLVINSLGFIQSLVPESIYGQNNITENWTLSQVQKELGSLVSLSTSIFGPEDSRWSNATERYQDYALPSIQLVVQPGEETDISTIVQYANEKHLPFLLVNRGHSLTFTVGAFTGIQIDVRSLRDIAIQPNGETARLQAGAYNYEVIETLWEDGYITTSGTCSCVGMVGPALGGGHGPFQGDYGLISDNIVTMNVVLGNGAAIEVNETSHPDLWWAMRGAGHNFGIVTSFELKIRPARRHARWYYKQYVFTGDKLESLFEELNRFHNNGAPPEAMKAAFVLSFWAVILWTFVYDGSQEDAETSLAPFEQLGPISTQGGDILYPEVSEVLGAGMTTDLCAANKTHIISTAGLQVYSLAAERQIYELYNQNVAKHPEFQSTKVLHEGYAVEGVRRVNSDESAYPLRDDDLLMYFDLILSPDSKLEDFAREWARQTRDIWNAGQPSRRPTTYVNYAFGDESTESMYGYEPWRMQRLRDLKARYDPENRFAYYNPIIPRA
ncbi:FAD-binding domain-containing protein [Penicillium herquei]|nr:FAD-binding domain-containing protein [Penicillium herquei]